MYSIEELAKRAGISKRTLHYYVKKGLLPAPGTRGPSTRYSQEYLDRLQVIKVLKSNYLPLDEIALLLGKLSAEEISRLAFVSEQELFQVLKKKDLYKSLKSSKEAMLQEDASEYIEKVLDLSRSTTARKRTIAEKRRPPVPSSPAPSSQWERHKLSEGVELHVDNSLAADRRKLVERLIKYAKKLFSKS